MRVGRGSGANVELGIGARRRVGTLAAALVLAGGLAGCGSISSAYSPWTDARLDQSCAQFLADPDVAAKTRFVDEAAKGYHLTRAGQAGLETEIEAACTGHGDLELLGALLAVGCGKPVPGTGATPEPLGSPTPSLPGDGPDAGAGGPAPTVGSDPALTPPSLPEGSPTTVGAVSFRGGGGAVVDPGGVLPRAGGGSGGGRSGGGSSGGSKSGGSKSGGGSSGGGSSSGGNTPTTRSSSSGNTPSNHDDTPTTERNFCA